MRNQNSIQTTPNASGPRAAGPNAAEPSSPSVRNLRTRSTRGRALILTVVAFGAFALGAASATSFAGEFAGEPVPVPANAVPHNDGVAKHADERPQPGDRDVALAVQSALWNDDAVPSHRIDIEVDDGVVTLVGSVRDLLAKQRSVQVAATLRGVRTIVDRIVVDPPRRADGELIADVREALQIDPATDAYEIAVSATDGVVTLRGEVDSWTEKLLCRTVASGIRGVREVRDETHLIPKADRPDLEILSDIERRLEHDVWIDAGPLGVVVQDGVARVSGGVGSLAEKHRIGTTAWVAGVRKVDVSGVSVEWQLSEPMERTDAHPEIPDTRIETAIRDAFLYDPRVFSFEPAVHVADGVVTLTGTVDSLATRRAAESDATNTIGVWRVRNFLKVRPETEVPDAALMREVRRAMLRDPWVDRYDIAVSAVDGRVYLHGQVDSAFEKRHAERLAERVTGVRDLANRLSVDHVTVSVKSDRAIRQDIDDELTWSPFVDGDHVTVMVDDGVATLTGTVDTWHERRMATQNAKEGGAIAVVNELGVLRSTATLLD